MEAFPWIGPKSRRIGTKMLRNIYLTAAQHINFREIPPGVLQHVLTVLVSGAGFCSCPGFHLRLRASDCSPGLAFCFTEPWTLLGSAARNSPTTRAKTGRTAHVFTAQGGTRRQLNSIFPRKRDVGTPKKPSPGKCRKIPGNSGFPVKSYRNAKRRADPGNPGKFILLRGPNWGLFLYQRVPH